jgi:hypothetical protein
MGWWNKLVRDKKASEENISLDGKFKDAVATSPLVVSGDTLQNKSLNSVMEDTLQERTKNELVDFAQENFGIDLDRRLTKQNMINRILEESE